MIRRTGVRRLRRERLSGTNGGNIAAWPSQSTIASNRLALPVAGQFNSSPPVMGPGGVELALEYTYAQGVAWQTDTGLAGRPALRRGVFSPRPPWPTRSRHDASLARSTHVTLDASGTWRCPSRERDERRVDLDRGAFDSVAGRLSCQPIAWACRSQLRARVTRRRISLCNLEAPVIRVTASAGITCRFDRAESGRPP